MACLSCGVGGAIADQASRHTCRTRYQRPAPAAAADGAPGYPEGVATQTPVKPHVREPGTGGGLGDPVNIIVLNDNHNTFEGVARTLAQYLPGVDYERGMAFANEIHNRGRARVWRGDREAAELYWHQLQDAGLTMAPLA